MTKQTVGLGENAFVAEQEIFLSVDASDKERELPRQGKTNGLVNSPGAQAVQPDAVEQGIIQKITQTAQQTREALSRHFSGFGARLQPIVRTWEPGALVNDIQKMPKVAKDKLDGQLRTFKNQSAIKKPEWLNAKEAYEKFRRDHKLVRTPDYSAWKSVILWFSGLIVVEAFLNSTLLWDLTGILPGLGQAALITAVNVLFGAGLTGLFFRYKNVSRGVRWYTLVSALVFLLVLAFNLGVGHYRDALVEGREQLTALETPLDWDSPDTGSVDTGFFDYTKRAWESFLADPFDIDSILSVLLIIVGIGFFGYATHKWYSMFDPYPGYRKSHLALQKTNENYKNLVETTRVSMEQKIKDVRDRIGDERTKVMNMITQRNELIDRARTLQNSYHDWLVVLGKTRNHLLELYRDANRQARSEPVPDHFNAELPIDDALAKPPDFDPPALQNAGKVIEAVREAENEIQAIADDIWRQFDSEAGME